MVRRNLVIGKSGIGTATVLALMLVLVGSVRPQEITTTAKNNGHSNDDQTIRQVAAGFSEGWNRHDAAMMCASVADDVQWISHSGGVTRGHDAVQTMHDRDFKGKEKNSHRVDEVKSITYLRPDLVSVDDFWTMTGSQPFNRQGYVNFVMERRGNQWLIVTAHTADYEAKTSQRAK